MRRIAPDATAGGELKSVVRRRLLVYTLVAEIFVESCGVETARQVVEDTTHTCQLQRTRAGYRKTLTEERACATALERTAAVPDVM